MDQQFGAMMMFPSGRNHDHDKAILALKEYAALCAKEANKTILKYEEIYIQGGHTERDTLLQNGYSGLKWWYENA